MNLDRKIVIERPILTRNDYGESEEGWTTFAIIWANINYKGGREGFYARQVVATGDVVFKIRYTAGITPKMRILFNNTVYNIIAISETGRNHFMEITAKSHDND
jgi:SPP1 family predicted phage head-tail adaptor